jgi:hypothetical protein
MFQEGSYDPVTKRWTVHMSENDLTIRTVPFATTLAAPPGFTKLDKDGILN